MNQPSPTPPVILVTGSAKRIGAQIIRHAHANGYNVIVHYHQSANQAMTLIDELNAIRINSAKTVSANLTIVNNDKMLAEFAEQVMSCFNRLDALVNNASRFYPTPMGTIDNNSWEELFLTNAKAPLLLAQAFRPFLQQSQGSIINLLDIHANGKPFKNYPVYCMAKAAAQTMVESLALELAPSIRVNGIAPGANIFPEMATDQAIAPSVQSQITHSIPLQRIGSPTDIANAVMYLLQAEYVTGQVLSVDGGRGLTIA